MTKISVITPSFNQGQFLPINLASVSTQRGVSVEHIVVDPGSTDGSTEIARGASGVVLIAEPDRGQSDGINKGFARSTGDILVWLNSDDFYPSDDVLATVAQYFCDNPNASVVYGDVTFVGETGEFLRKGFVNGDAEQLLASFEYQVGIVQPGVFWRRHVFEEIGGPSEEFEYCMDYELWVRMASKGYRWKYLPKVLAHHRWWGGMKTSSRRDLSLREHFKVCDRYFGYVHWKWLDRYADYLCSNQDGVVNHANSIDASAKQEAVRRAIDEVVTQEMLAILSASHSKELVETYEYIKSHCPEKKRIYFNQAELDITSETAPDPMAMQRAAWNVFDVITSSHETFSAYHVPENFHRYFAKGWHEVQLKKSQVALRRLCRERRSDICVVVGNGPSLRKSNLSLLANVDTIVSNFAVLSKELSRNAKFLTVVNDLVAKQGAIEFNVSKFIKVVPFWLANYFNESDSTFFVNATVKPQFGLDFVSDASWRSTVSFFNLQLAYALGYQKVILVGFDHSYVQPKGVVEGVVIKQIEDDENHFDPRYFKGKDWQAADITNMEKMYAVAKTAYEKDRREIINCTIGGKLEIFRRGDLEEELSLAGISVSSQVTHDVSTYPKLLMIDSTPVGHTSATGQLKQTFLGNWPDSHFLQIWETWGSSSSLRAMKLGESIDQSRATAISVDQVIALCREFQPDVIYFRPVDSELLCNAAKLILSALNKPLVIHMMDDWPERLKASDSQKYLDLDGALRQLLDRTSQRLSICQAMSDAYRERYGGDWVPLGNGVDVQEFPQKKWANRPPVSQQFPFVIRYMGALANDMTYSSVREIAAAVSTLQAVCAVRFEIYTMDWSRSEAERDIGKLPGVSVHPLVEKERYKQSLAEADALVIAYNFDPQSISYIGLSLANKMPECLASGAPLIAYGPLDVATIRYLKESGCAQVVDKRDRGLLVAAIQTLVEDTSLCKRLGEQARDHVAKNFSKRLVQKRFKDYMSGCRKGVHAMSAYVVGPFAREHHAHCDETNCISELFKDGLHGQVMIDAGAHHGWALEPFLDRAWRIYAFEPDNQNREKLLERLANHKNKHLVSLDTRCVSNKSQKGVSFFTSEQSTGISGLSAFHETHQESQKVDVITLMEFFQDKPMSAIDFLKIDTEGHDLFVLQGFPWERGKPAVIECEFEDAKTVPLGYTFHDLAKYLVEKGYTVYVSEWHPIIRYGIRHDWHRLIRYPCELADAKGWGNLLAFRDPIDESMLAAAVKKVMKIGSEPAKVTRSARALSAPPTTSPALQQPIVTKKPQPSLVARYTIAMGRPIVGANWSDPVMVNGMSARLVASGQRATMALSLKRDQDLLVLLTLPPRSSREHCDGVRIEIDGTVVLHTLHLDINPPCVVASVPARQAVQHTMTELALVDSKRTERSGLTDGRHNGLAVVKVSVIPAFPKNHARALTVEKPWYQRFASQLNKKPLAFPFSHFDGLAYVEANPDVAEAILGGRLSSGVGHYQRYGRSEGRAYVIALQNNPSIGGLAEIFDGQAYLETYPDIAEAVRGGMRSSALEHYVKYGRNEGRRARLRFDGTSRRGTALDLVELDALHTAKAATEAVKVAFTKEVATLQAKLDRLTKEQDKQQAAQLRMETQNADLRRELRDGLSRSARAAELARVEQMAVRNAERMLLELGTVQKQQETQNARLTHPSSYAFNGLGYQSFPRQLTKANADRLAKHWGPLLGATMPEKELYYCAHRICQMENACLGRLATSIDSMLLRMLVARSVKSQELAILEIGTLFGLGLIALHEALAPLGKRLRFTAIDPLEGYYGKEQRDILTGVLLSREVFDENLRRAGMTQNDVTVIQQLSTDERALRQARESQYAVVIIDGDHRYAGVKHDVESYLCTVMPGGYVLVDDYGNPNWPDVKAYVDAEVMGRKDLECLGIDWHTAVFRVRNER